MVDSAFHSYLVDQMSSTKNCLRHGVFLTTISPHSGSAALRQMGPILENGHKVVFFCFIIKLLQFHGFIDFSKQRICTSYRTVPSVILQMFYRFLIFYNLFHEHLKLVCAIFYQIFMFSPNDSPLKTMKNVFYFI